MNARRDSAAAWRTSLTQQVAVLSRNSSRERQRGAIMRQLNDLADAGEREAEAAMIERMSLHNSPGYYY
jgi:hypothetical protein